MKWILLFFLCVFFHNSRAQVKGILTTDSGIAISNATIVLKTQKGSTLSYAISKGNGTYTINHRISDSLTYVLEVKHINFETQQKQITLKNNAGDFVLIPATRQLAELVIKAKLPPIIAKSDTIEFKASSYMNTETVKVQDLLKSIPGVKVDVNGNITYNGQKVEKILLDGDDLTGTSYKLISKNLTANLIDTIQIIKNFNENRLLKTVTKSERVGINLKVKANARGKFSGTTAVAASINKRYEFDINSIYLKQKAKWFGIINLNNISNNTASDIDYYYNPATSENSNYSILNIEKSIVNTGIIAVPSIATKYAYNNNDITSGLMFNNTINNTLKVKGAVGFNRQVTTNISDWYNTTVLDANTQWQVRNVENNFQRGDQYYGSVNITNDKLKKIIQELNIKCNITQNNNHYTNKAYIAISDTLTERLKSKSSNFQANYSATIQRSAHKVWTINALLIRTDLSQRFNATTERLSTFFNLSTDYNLNDQTLETNKLFAYLSSMVNGKLKTHNYIYGFELNNKFISTNNNILFKSEYKPTLIGPENTTTITTSQFLLKGLYGINTSKTSLSISGIAGISKAALVTQSKLDKNIFTIQSSIAFSRRFSNQKNLSASYQFKLSPPALEVFYPLNILSGNATILYGAKEIKAERKHFVTLSFSSSNFFKFLNYYLNATYSHQDLNYGNNLSLNSNYIVLYQTPQKNSSNFAINSSIEKYISALKSKFSLQLNSTISNGYSIINDYYSKNNLFNIGTSIKWNSSFKFPVNGEAQFNPQFFINRTITNQNVYESNTTNLQAYGKLKLVLTRKIYSSILYNWYKLNPQSSFNSVDAYLSYKHSEKISFSLTGHNLLNNKKIVQKIITSTSTSMIMFNVIPAYILFKLSLNF